MLPTSTADDAPAQDGTKAHNISECNTGLRLSSRGHITITDDSNSATDDNLDRLLEFGEIVGDLQLASCECLITNFGKQDMNYKGEIRSIGIIIYQCC